jgi:signal transduction histidine kinase
MEVEEEERARIGRELHDGMGAQLALVALGIAKLKQQCLRKAQPLVRQMKELEAIVRELGDYVRSVSHLLYSPSLEHFGLESALIDFCSEFAEKSGAHVEFVHAGLSRDLPPKVELCVYRAVQEALHNVQKHSGSTEARVELEVTSGLIQLRVSDKGKGFNPALIACGEGIGLASMAERVRSLGGQFSVQSSPEEGTSVVVSVPISLVSPT